VCVCVCVCVCQIVIARSTTTAAVSGSDLQSVVTAAFPDAEVVPVARKYFNETKGSMYVKLLAVKGSMVPSDTTMYLALASCAALLKYIEFAQNITYAAGSLRVCACSGLSEHRC
jgi:DNA mismatch repair protein MSH4